MGIVVPFPLKKRVPVNVDMIAHLDRLKALALDGQISTLLIMGTSDDFESFVAVHHESQDNSLDICQWLCDIGQGKVSTLKAQNVQESIS